MKKADIVIENFTPRVIEAFDLDWPVVHEANPRAIMVRMPAFGLDGPWRDRPGFAQTMEQITGLAWVTSHPEDQPRIQRGPCDPNGGLHAVFAALVALERRDRTGEGCFVEAPMFEAAMNVGAEPAIEWSANGVMVERMGNRSPAAAPQNLFATDRPEHWLAVSCSTDEQWRALAAVIGRPELADEPELQTLAGRRAAADRLDPLIAEWAAGRELHAAVAELLAAGVPAAPGTDARRASFNEQMAARGYFETIEHPVVGTHSVPVLPFRYAQRRALGPAPGPDARPAQRRDPRRLARPLRRRARRPRGRGRHRHLARRGLSRTRHRRPPSPSHPAPPHPTAPTGPRDQPDPRGSPP